MHELVVRGGTVVDGTGGAPQVADIGIAGGVITAIGPNLDGHTVIDATGAIVTPGFIDLHTHYDPQVLWDPHLSPSSQLGVTSVIAGNCGFSVAPCPPELRASLMRTLDGVEDMRVATLEAGITWDFETYPEYLRAVAERGTVINFGGYVGHSAVRLWVMGDDAYERHATDDELARMIRVVDDAMAAGALGFSSDRSPFHRGDGGRPVPSAVATQGELDAIWDAVGRLGWGSCTSRPARTTTGRSARGRRSSRRRHPRRHPAHPRQRARHPRRPRAGRRPAARRAAARQPPGMTTPSQRASSRGPPTRTEMHRGRSSRTNPLLRR